MSDDDPPPYPGVDRRSCQLLGPTALVVQALMGVLVILSLVYKRHRESPKRPWRIWLFDVSKQVVGQMFVHGFNVLISHIVSVGTSSNACITYFLNILIDTTLGVALIYFILHFLTYLFTERLGLKGFESGVYGSPPSFNYWCRQAALYVLSLTTMKLLVVGLLALFPGIFKLGEWLLSWTWTEEGDAFQVIFTMGIFPIVMNILQFWLIDSIVKASSITPLALDSQSPDSIHPEDREPLFNAPSDDEDADGYRPRDIENPHPPRTNRASSFESDDASGDNSFTFAGSTPGNKSTETHSYPPSLSSSLTSDSSSTHQRTTQAAPKPAKNLMKKTKRRGPPAPLHIRPVRQPAVNSPAPVTPSPEPPRASEAQKHEEDEVDDWGETWDDDAESDGKRREGAGSQRIG